MGHHGHSYDHHDPVLDECRHVMHEDHRAVVAKVEVAVARLASPMWRILNAFGIPQR